MRGGPITEAIKRQLLADPRIVSLEPTEAELDSMISFMLQEEIARALFMMAIAK